MHPTNALLYQWKILASYKCITLPMEDTGMTHPNIRRQMRRSPEMSIVTTNSVHPTYMSWPQLMTTYESWSCCIIHCDLSLFSLRVIWCCWLVHQSRWSSYHFSLAKQPRDQSMNDNNMSDLEIQNGIHIFACIAQCTGDNTMHNNQEELPATSYVSIIIISHRNPHCNELLKSALGCML